MSRLSEGIEKKLNDKFYHKYTDMQGRKCEQLSINKERIKDVSKAIADAIRIDEEEVKKAIICGLQEDSYDRKGVREYRGCTVSQIFKAINKDCIVIGGKRGEDD